MLRMAYFLEAAHSAVSKKTHMLQVRCANPTGNFAPTRLFELRMAYVPIPHRPAVGMPVFCPAYSALPKRTDFSRFAGCEGGAKGSDQLAARTFPLIKGRKNNPA